MASLQELTAQVVALTAEVQGLTGRLAIAEQAASAQQMQGGNGGGGGGAGVFDKKRLYPKDLKDTTSFRAWAERFIAWLSMDNDEIGKARRLLISQASRRSSSTTRRRSTTTLLG